MDLHDQLLKVSSREELALFVQALLTDLQTDRDSWENVTLERYLDALAAVIEGVDGFFQNARLAMPTNVDWRFFGQLLLTAKVYE